MSDDFLSQDQVDDLLQQSGPTSDSSGAGDNQGEGQGGAEGSGEINYGALTQGFELFGDKAKSVLSTVLNRTISFSVETSSKADGAQVASKVDGELLAVNAPMTGGIEGPLIAVFTKKDVAVLSDLMMLGDGTAAYTDDHKDAISELVNQILGAFTAGINERLSESASVGNITVDEFSLAQPGIDMESSQMGILRMSVEGIEDSYMALLCSTEVAKALCSAAPGAGQDSDEDLMSEDSGSGIGLSEDEMNDLAGVVSNVPASSDSFSESSLSVSDGLPGPKENVDMLLDVDLDVSIELGTANLSIKRILDLAPGAVVELDRMAGEPVDLVVNGKVVARGEVVVVDENFGIRIVSLVSAEDRIRSLQ